MQRATGRCVSVIVTACVLLALPVPADAAPKADFYIATNGDDSWSGRLATPNAARTDGPLASLGGARDAIRKMKKTSDLTRPVTVLLRRGTYRTLKPVEFLPIDSGSQDAPITYAAYLGEKPVISGGLPIKGWEKGENGIWTADVQLSRGHRWRFRQMWVNGKRCVPARTPNFGKALWSAGAAKPEGDEIKNPLFNFTHITYNAADSGIWNRLSESKDKGIFVAFHSFTSSRHNILSIDKQRRAVFSPNPCEKQGLQTRRYYVAYNRESLDAAGEWYLDMENWSVSYYPREDEDMTKAEVIVPSGRILLKATGDAALGKWVEYLRFEGLSFQYTDWIMGDDTMMDGHSAMEYDPTTTAVVYMTYARHCELTGCEIVHTGNWGLQFGEGCRRNKAEQCHLHDLGGGGVVMGENEKPEHDGQRAEHNVVHNCFIHHGGRVFHAAVGVWLGSSNYSTVSHNEISDFYWCGITASRAADIDEHTKSNVIEYNHIHHLAWNAQKDLGGIYTTGESPGTVIRNNVIHHISSIVRRGRGIYLDQGSADIVVENNLVYLVNDGAFHQNWGKNNTARNNIFVFADEYGVITGGGSWRGGGEKGVPYTFEGNIVCTRRGVPTQNVNKEVRSNRNLYWQQKDPEKLSKWLAGEKSRQREVDSIVADPLFVDAEHFDFRIDERSPAIREIGFKPFDPRQAGLVGDKKWTSLPGKTRRPKIKFWSQRSRELNVSSETDRWRAGFTP
ncbi:MAG: right-handed parallel beta-helix repeat-containing protein [Planctomycetota bacterium]